MGHSHLGPLPRTRKWQEVVGLVAAGAGAEQVANAVMHAAERGLHLGAEHRALVESVWLLAQLPSAAQKRDFAAALRGLGVDVPDRPGLMDVIAGVSRAVDRRLLKVTGRTDLGELAQAAACESIVQVVTEKTRSLFGATPADVREGIAKIGTKKQFGEFSRHFFARLTDKVLQYYVSRCTAECVGSGLRFPTLAAKAAFDDALKLHCFEASRIVEKMAGDWYSKSNWKDGDISRDAARRFALGGLRKMVDELKAGAQ